MNTFKRTLAIVLTVCMLAAFVVPAVSAATPTNRLYNMQKAHADLTTQPLDNCTNKNLVKGYTISPHNDATADRTAKYVGQSAAKDVKFLKNYGLYSYQTAADAGYWVAIELTTVEVDKYLVNFNTSTSGLKTAGKFDVYVIPSFDYSAMDDAALKTAIDAKLVAANKLGTYDMKAGGDHSIGVVDFKAAGNYIVVMKLTGTATVDKHDGINANLHLKYINMTPSTDAANLTVGASAPVEEDVIDINGVKKTASEAAAAINAANSGTITLLDDLELDADIYVAPDVTLDLAGRTLDASVSVAGKIVDSEGGGKVKAGANLSAADTDGCLPLELEAGWYTLVKAETKTEAVTGKTTDSATFWFDFSVAGATATNVKIGVDCDYEGATDLLNAEAPSELMAAWASKEAGQMIKLSVTGLEGVVDFEMKPYIEANGVKIYASAIALG